MTEKEVYTRLKNDTTISNSIEGRIYPLVAPQNVSHPFMTYQVIAGINLQCMGGEIYQGDFRFQLNIYANSYGELKTVYEAVKNCLTGFMDSNSIMTFDDYDNETQLYKQVVDFKIKD